MAESADRLEPQADRVAEQVMRAATVPTIARQSTAQTIGRRGPDREELARPERIDPGATSREPAATAGLEAFRGGGRPLPPAARAFFEPRFGTSFEDVRVHTGARAEDAAARIGARAFTLGSSVVFGRGEYDPEGQAGGRLLAHELTHVVQQSGGGERVQRQVQIDPFVASAAAVAGFDPDVTTAFLAGLTPAGLRAVLGATRFSLNRTIYTSADTVGQNLGLPLLSERDLRAIPQPNLRDPRLDPVWNDTALIKKGKKKQAVRLVQQALQAWGRGKPVPEDPLPRFGDDAFFWDETLAAVERFQGEWTGAGAPLAVDGLVGPLTLAALEAAMAELNVSEFWLNTAPHNLIRGVIHHILPPASWSVVRMMRATLVARATAAGQPVAPFARCRGPNNRLAFTAAGPANLDQQILAHEQQHEADIGRAVGLRITPWQTAVEGLVTTGRRFRAVDQATAEALIYAEIGRRTAPTAGDPCSVGRALEVDLVDFEFALHRLPGGMARFTGFTTNAPNCARAQANIDNQGVRGRAVPAVACNAPPRMTISQRVPV